MTIVDNLGNPTLVLSIKPQKKTPIHISNIFCPYFTFQCICHFVRNVKSSIRHYPWAHNITNMGAPCDSAIQY